MSSALQDSYSLEVQCNKLCGRHRHRIDRFILRHLLIHKMTHERRKKITKRNPLKKECNKYEGKQFNL